MTPNTPTTGVVPSATLLNPINNPTKKLGADFALCLLAIKNQNIPALKTNWEKLRQKKKTQKAIPSWKQEIRDVQSSDQLMKMVLQPLGMTTTDFNKQSPEFQKSIHELSNTLITEKQADIDLEINALNEQKTRLNQMHRS